MPTTTQALQGAIPLPKPNGSQDRGARLEQRAHAALSADPLNWSAPHLPWRIRFRSPAREHRGASVLQLNNYKTDMQRRLMSHVKGDAEPAGSFGLYLERASDVRRLLELYPQEIETIQDRASHERAREIAAALAAS